MIAMLQKGEAILAPIYMSGEFFWEQIILPLYYEHLWKEYRLDNLHCDVVILEGKSDFPEKKIRKIGKLENWKIIKEG